MGIRVNQWRVSIGPFCCCSFNGYHSFFQSTNLIFLFNCWKKLLPYLKYIWNLTQYLLVSSYKLPFVFEICSLHLRAGDIECSPGSIYENLLFIMHLNIRSIRNKIESIQDNFVDFDILCFSETHLDVNVPSDFIFQIVTIIRTGRTEIGMAMNY